MNQAVRLNFKEFETNALIRGRRNSSHSSGQVDGKKMDGKNERPVAAQNFDKVEDVGRDGQVRM